MQDKFDKWLCCIVMSLCIIGLVMVASASAPVATENFGDPLRYAKRQAMGLGVGLMGCIALAWCPYEYMKRYAWWVYLLAIIGLIMVFIPGISHSANGATRWIGIGSIHFQPSELAKIGLALSLSRFLETHCGRVNDRYILTQAILIPVPMMLLVVLEPDFGTSVLMGGITLCILFLAGMTIKHTLTAGLCAFGIGTGVLWLRSYRVDRLLSYLSPWDAPLDGGYQIIQSLVAYSSGGLFGQGLGHSQAKHLFLPESWTDFIAAVLAEELGLLGLFVLFGLYAALMLRGLQIARHAPDLFGTLLATTLTLLVGFQAMLNLYISLGLLPNKGLVLPFMSYGPSALSMHLFTIGLLLNISAHRSHRKMHQFQRIAVVPYPAAEPPQRSPMF